MEIFDFVEIEEIKPQRNKDAEIMVSIYCPTYNHGKYLRDALESIVMQKFDFNYEVIVVDDASTDNTSDIIREYVIKYPELFHVFLLKKNTFKHPMRYKLYNEIKKEHFCGKYAAYCEGDDYWTDPYKLAKQIAFLEENPSFSASAHNVRCVDEKGNLLHRDFNLYPIVESHVHGVEQVKKRILAGQTASIVHRNFWKDISQHEYEFFLNNKVNGDHKLNVIIGLRGNTYCFRDIMADHRRCFSGTSWTAQTANKNMLWFDFEFGKIIDEYIFKVLNEHILNKQHFKNWLFASRAVLWSSFNLVNLKIYIKFLLKNIEIKIKKTF